MKANLLAVLIVVALSATHLCRAHAQGETWEVPTCAKSKVAGKRVRVWDLTYVVPRHALLRKFHDVDYGGYRIFVQRSGKPEVLTLFWRVNVYPETIENSRKYVRRSLTLPDGRKGVDARGVVSDGGAERAWRSTGVMALYAYYRDVCFEKR
jgi:hypothetical protein